MLTAALNSHFTLLPRAIVTVEWDWHNMLLFSWDHNYDLSVLTVGPFNLCFEWPVY